MLYHRPTLSYFEDKFYETFRECLCVNNSIEGELSLTQYIRYSSSRMPCHFLSARRYASAVLAMAVSASPSACLLHCIETAGRIELVFIWGLPSTYPTLCCKRNKYLKTCSLSIVLTAADQKPQKSFKRRYYPSSQRLNVNVMLSRLSH